LTHLPSVGIAFVNFVELATTEAPSTSSLVSLLDTGGDKVAANLKLIVDVSIYIFVSEELQDLLLILFHFVYHWNQEN
jgi:hypothetical protein